MDFWSFAKYPPDIPFLTWSFAATFLSLAVVDEPHRYSRGPQASRSARSRPVFLLCGALLRSGRRGGDRENEGESRLDYAIWLMLLLAMAWPCAWYYAKKRNRPNFITRYF